MGRLRSVKPRVAQAAPRIARKTDAEGHRKGDEGRSWYHLARWKHPVTGLRIRVLIRDNFTCQRVGCGKYERNLSLLVADHKTPHRGDPALFWDEDNVETLCKPCHDKAKQAEERAARAAGHP
jgi:5-methylcytosine-specific restriction protein A